MEFRELSTFLQVAKLQSFSKAAKVLGYSQAAVTIQIKQLEQELGAHLFDRIGKQTTLTHQGSVFYEYSASIIRDMAQAKDAVSHPQKLTGRLCIGTIESICASIFPNPPDGVPQTSPGSEHQHPHRLPGPAVRADQQQPVGSGLFYGQAGL